jgi:hypothetical protein
LGVLFWNRFLPLLKGQQCKDNSKTYFHLKSLD